MGTNGVPWSKAGLDGRVIMMRKRNNSGGEMDGGNFFITTKRSYTNFSSDSGSSLLCNPSSALQKLVPKIDSTSVVPQQQNPEIEHTESTFFQRPVMQFVMQSHDLESLQLAMKQAVRYVEIFCLCCFCFVNHYNFIRKAMCRVYAMQALNWLLRCVTQPVCLHDLLWWFVTSLTPAESDDGEDEPKVVKKVDEQVIITLQQKLFLYKHIF